MPLPRGRARLAAAAAFGAASLGVAPAPAPAPGRDGPMRAAPADRATPAYRSDGQLRACGDIRGSADAPKRIGVDGVSCARGRRIAEVHWLLSGRFDACAGRRRSCLIRGFTCARAPAARRHVRCAAPGRVVRFRYVT